MLIVFALRVSPIFMIYSIMYANASVCLCVCRQTCSMMSTSWWNVKLPKLKPYVALGAISPDKDALFNFTPRLTD